MHILIIPSWYLNTYDLLSGIFFKEQAESLAKYNSKVGVIAIQDISIRQILNKKKIDYCNKTFIENDVFTQSIQYPAIPKLHKIRRKIKELLFEIFFKEYIKKNGIPDIVHLHSFMNGELAIWVKKKYNIPYVVTEHFSGFARNIVSCKDMKLAKKVFEESEYNMAVSNELAQLLKEKVNIEFNYLPNIVNIDFFDIKIGLNREGFEFINIAHLNKNKNTAMLVKAFYKAFKNKPQIRLTIVGDGPEYDNINQLIKNLNLEDQVLLYGHASREEVKNLLQVSDSFAMSSKYETFGVVLIEALACGLPVVATKCGGPESIIHSDKVGILSEIDENSFSEKLLEMYKNRLNFDSQYIRNYVESNFSEKAVISKLKDVYEKVLEYKSSAFIGIKENN